MAGHVGLELRNVVANYHFESSCGFPGSQPNSVHGDYLRLSFAAVAMQLLSRLYGHRPLHSWPARPSAARRSRFGPWARGKICSSEAASVGTPVGTPKSVVTSNPIAPNGMILL